MSAGQVGNATAVRSASSRIRLIWHLLRYQNKVFLRNPFSAFFSLAFPLIFLLLFGLLFGNEPNDQGVRVIQFLVASMVVFAVVTTSYMNLSIVISMNRDVGIFKRVRGTPVPLGTYVTARILSTVWWTMVAVLLQVVAGVLVFNIDIIWRLVPAALVTVSLGIVCFTSLGVALAAVIPNGEAAPAIANGTALPLLFLSGVFIPLDAAPRWVQAIGEIFPIRHFYLALGDTFNPFYQGSGFAWGRFGVLALWTVLGIIVAVRMFRWEPRPGVGIAA
jgi:ABC-2 type transport system permease protein